MALKPKITTAELEALPEGVREHYTPVTGAEDSHMLDVTPQGGYALENVAPIKSALEAERRRGNAAESRLKIYEIPGEDGADPSYIDADDARNAMETVAKGTGDVDERIRTSVEAERSRLGKAHKLELETATGSLTAAEADISRMMLQTAGLSNNNRVKGNAKFVIPLWEQVSRVVKDADGKRVIEILDENGEVRPGSGAGGRLTSEEYFDELSNDPDLAVAFAGGSSSGTGGGRNDKPRGGGRTGFVSAGDSDGLSGSLEDIASGKVTVN